MSHGLFYAVVRHRAARTAMAGPFRRFALLHVQSALGRIPDARLDGFAAETGFHPPMDAPFDGHILAQIEAFYVAHIAEIDAIVALLLKVLPLFL